MCIGGVPSHPCPRRPDELQLPQGEWGEGRGSPSGVLPITLEIGIFISTPTPFPHNKAQCLAPMEGLERAHASPQNEGLLFVGPVRFLKGVFDPRRLDLLRICSWPGRWVGAQEGLEPWSA